MQTIADLSDEPKYSIKVVSTQTGIQSVTIRAWERRYKLLQPQRAENRYRRYSEKDIALLQWVKTRIESGIAISNVVGELTSMYQKGIWPEIVPGFQPFTEIQDRRSLTQLSADLYQALIHSDEPAADAVLHAAQASHDLGLVCLKVIAPCLVEIGQAWHRGDIRISTEHFASTLLRGRINNYLLSFPNRRNAPYIITGCAPDERHEIGILILSVLLRREGYRVEFLGPDLPLDDLVEYARYENPDLICLSATLEQNVRSLASMKDKLDRQNPAPLFVFGGQAFITNPALREKIPGLFLGETADQAVQKISRLLEPAAVTP